MIDYKKSQVVKTKKFSKTDTPSALNYNPSFKYVYEKPKTCKFEKLFNISLVVNYATTGKNYSKNISNKKNVKKKLFQHMFEMNDFLG